MIREAAIPTSPYFFPAASRQQFVSKGPLSAEVTPQSSGEEVIGNIDGRDGQASTDTPSPESDV